MIDEITITSLSGRGSITIKTGDQQGYWLGPVDWGQAQGQHQTYSYYHQVGESIVSTSLLTRPLSITGWVIDVEGDTMETRCALLNTFFSPVEDYMLEYKNRKISFRPDSSVIYSPEYSANNQLIRRFLLQATCPYPLFAALEATAIPFDFSGKRFRFPTGFGQEAPMIFATTEKTYSAEVYNAGGFQTGFTATFWFHGEVTNPRITSLTSGKFIGVNRTFQEGERLDLSTMAGSKGMTLWSPDGKRENLIRYRDYRMSWIQLVPGSNLLALDCDDLEQRNNMSVTVYYTPLYLEVE